MADDPVIERAAVVIAWHFAETDTPHDAARALRDAGLLADPGLADEVERLRGELDRRDEVHRTAFVRDLQGLLAERDALSAQRDRLRAELEAERAVSDQLAAYIEDLRPPIVAQERRAAVLAVHRAAREANASRAVAETPLSVPASLRDTPSPAKEETT